MRLLAVIAGASRWPLCPALTSTPSFARSADLVAELLMSPDGLHLRRTELFWSFDDDRGADKLDERLGNWLDERLGSGVQSVAVGEPISDILFFYIGHGHRAGDSLFLTVQSTRETNIEQSSWSAVALAHTLRQHAPRLRKHIVLDCCHGAAALAAFQRPDDVGVAVFYAAEKYSTALALPEHEYTLFTETLVATITAGISGAAPELSLVDLCDAIRPRLQVHRTEPNVIDTVIRGTPVSGVGIFPNRFGALPSSSERMRREMYSRMLELERRFDQRLARRNEQLQTEYEQKLAASALNYERQLADSASRMKLLSSELQSKIDQAGLQDALNRTIADVREEGPLTEARVLRKADQHGRRRALVVFGLGLGCMLVAVKLGVLSTVLRRPDEIAVINPALGWQGAVAVKRDEQLCITADGRVHLGLNQVVNMMNAARVIIARFAEVNSETRRIVTGGDAQALGSDKDVELSRLRFRRPWSDPNGVQLSDELLDAAILQTRCKWGELMGIEIRAADPLLSSRDPFAVLRDNDYTPDRVHCIGSRLELSARRSGELVFIVNDAINSDVFPDQRPRSKELYAALRDAANALPEESHYQRVIDVPSLPLFWYSDNGGQYTVRIRRGPCEDLTSHGGAHSALPITSDHPRLRSSSAK